MKEIFKNLSKWIFIWLWIVFVLWISYLAIKAWQTTNPWIAETTPLGGFYVNNWDTLSANKRNAMVDKVMIWQEVVISDTAAFDTQCMRRFFLDNGSADGYLYPRYIAPTQVTMSDPLYNRRIDSWNKTNFYVSGTTPTPLSVLKIEKLCP